MAYQSDSIQTIVDTIKLTNYSELRVTRVGTKDNEFEAVDIRQWFCTAKDSTMKPTQKGVRIRKDQLEQVLAAIELARH